MKEFLRSMIRSRPVRRARFDAARIGALLRHRLAHGPRPVRMLLLSDEGSFTSEQQFAPLRRWSRSLRADLGVVCRWTRIADGLRMLDLHRFDCVGVKLNFRTPAGRAGRIVAGVRARLARGARLAYFDGDDDAAIQWPEVLDLVDVYVKAQVFADARDYTKRYIGKSNLTDYVARTFGVSFADNPVARASGVCDAASLPKLFVGWSLALGDPISELADRLRGAPRPPKDLDIVCRAGVFEGDWMHHLRRAALERLEPLGRRFRVLAGTERVPRGAYYDELLRGRLCVSPFGYGEICWRDFEAILCGCLLVKPDMGHLRTRPDVFVPGVTYAPVRWDYADLEEVCARYLGDEDARLTVAEQARRILEASLGRGWFAGVIGELLGRVGLGGVERDATPVLPIASPHGVLNGL